MQRKALQVQVELDIQAITCPGVYLCPNGKVSLQLYMLDSCIQTISANPVFPILCHEKFIFYKTFYSAQRLTDLHRLLDNEHLYVEMIQWQDCEVGNVLATFQTNLSELLYPTTHEGSVAGIDIDLLMDAAHNFPGVIAPKVEVSTRTVIEDTVCDGKRCSSFVVNPKVIQSKGSQERRNPTHQRKVCHSAGYHRSRKCFKKMAKTKPPFAYKRVGDDLLSRKPQGLGAVNNEICNCRSQCNQSNGKYSIKSIDVHSKSPNRKTNCYTKLANCLCNSTAHEYELCPVCSKYKYYFKAASPTRSCTTKGKLAKSCTFQQRLEETRHKKCTCKEISNKGNARVIRCTSPKENDFSDAEKCFCLPKTKESLAEKLHRRLNQTLDSCSDCPIDCYSDGTCEAQRSPRFRGSDDLDGACDCPVVNIGDMYKKIYGEARSKYITPCCM